MKTLPCIVLALLSIWDYPARQPLHDTLRRRFVAAMKGGDAVAMEATCRKGVELFPEDPTWRYNLACALARSEKRADEALDELETAIDLGFRDRVAIEGDADLKGLSGQLRFKSLLEYADFMKGRPLLSGPLSAVAATGDLGRPVILGEQNLGWDFETGSFIAKMKLNAREPGGNVGDLYMNRDGQHSPLAIKDFPGVTPVQLDATGRTNQMDKAFPNILFPYPVFGNASLAMTEGPFWRSLPRAMSTVESRLLGRMERLYLSNQTWVYPSHADTAPIGTNGDVFASITPYWLTTAGRSWSDQPYLRAALEASRSFAPPVKAEIVKRGLLAPTIQTLIRKSLKGVTNEVAYLGAEAHPTALPPGGLELDRLKSAAKALTVETIPPLVTVTVAASAPKQKPSVPELTYARAFAWAFVLRADDEVREFLLCAKGAAEYEFVKTHGAGVDVKIERSRPDVAKVTINRRGMSPTNRVDIMVCGRNAGTGWGAPSYVSFARMDPSAPYSDPALTIQPQSEAAK